MNQGSGEPGARGDGGGQVFVENGATLVSQQPGFPNVNSLVRLTFDAV